MVIRHIVAVDPGDVNNGFCYFKHDSETGKADLRIKQILSGDGMSKILKMLYELNRDKDSNEERKTNPHNFFFVVENFRVDTKVRGAMFQWNDMKTSRMIGRVELCAEWMEAPVFLQEPTILGIMRKQSPFPVNKSHMQDDISAFLHGLKFMQDKNLVRTVDDVIIGGQERLA